MVAIAAVVLALLGTDVAAQDVRLRRGDRLELDIPQRPELERQLVIDNDGNVYIPVVGNISIQGQLITEAEATVLRALREIYPSVQSIRLNLIGEESRRLIYVHGEVLNPGKYEFEESPTLWVAIREAGGAVATASLDAVRIIRAEGEGRRTLIVNLQQIIESGEFDSLPKLRPGDTVIVPERSVQYTGTGAVKVIGAVTTPGPYNLVGERYLIDAVLAAGGPAENANLSEVTIVRTMPDGGQLAIRVDFNRYLEEGDSRHNPKIFPEDTVNIPSERNIVVVLLDPRFWLAVVTAVTTLYLLSTR
jgi:protein involved in polysaccharide export with SLBB domain